MFSKVALTLAVGALCVNPLSIPVAREPDFPNVPHRVLSRSNENTEASHQLVAHLPTYGYPLFIRFIYRTSIRRASNSKA